jgi:hypothetical protein
MEIVEPLARRGVFLSIHAARLLGPAHPSASGRNRRAHRKAPLHPLFACKTGCFIYFPAKASVAASKRKVAHAVRRISGGDAGWRLAIWTFRAADRHRPARAGRVFRGGALVALSEVEVQLLAVLLEGGGEIVPRDVIMQAVWSSRMTDEGVLTTAISRLRKQFGEAMIPTFLRDG